MLGKRGFNGSKNGLSNRTGKKNSDEPRSLSHLFLKTGDNNEVLPCYTQVLTKCSEEGVSIKDLDQLQQELEKLLNVCATRRRTFCSDFEQIDRTDDNKSDKKGKPTERPSSPKIRKVDEKKYNKEPKVPYKIVKNIHDAEVTKLEMPKVTIPRNDMKSKFWLSVDPYCMPVSKDDIAFIDDLMQECNKEADVKIPSLGPHYSLNWNNDTITDQLQKNMNFHSSKNKIVSMLVDESINSLYKTHRSVLGTNEEANFSSILPLASALIEEKSTNGFSSNQEKTEKIKDLGLKQLGGSNVCLDKRVRKELLELGILGPFEEKCKVIQGNYNEEDEILEEIEKCQKELIAVNNHNKRELNNLRYLIDRDLVRQELNERLDKVDNQVMDIYNRLLKVSEKNDEKTDERNKIEWEAVKIIQLQRTLHKEAMEMTDVRL